MTAPSASAGVQGEPGVGIWESQRLHSNGTFYLNFGSGTSQRVTLSLAPFPAGEWTHFAVTQIQAIHDAGSSGKCQQCPDGVHDADADNFCSDEDNCPDDFNPSQSDADGDGIGDVCDSTDLAACQECVDTTTWKNRGAYRAASNQCEQLVSLHEEAEVNGVDTSATCEDKLDALLGISANTTPDGSQCLADFCAEVLDSIDSGEVCTP